MRDNRIIILDGGMGRELERIGAPFSQPFWSAQALIEAPDNVADVHRHFIQSGAKVITTNSYAVVPPHIGNDLFNERGHALIRLAAELARQEADAAASPVQVAACVPPVFGSYRPDQFDPNTAPELIRPFFEEQAPYADIFLAETISSVEEALMIEDVYKEYGQSKPLWLSFTLEEFFDETKRPQLRSGEELYHALETILEQNTAQAILFNCCSVEDINAAFTLCTPLFKEHKDLRTGAYANAFSHTKTKRSPTDDISTLRDDITPDNYLEHARGWAQKGATIIGGCCGIGPEYITMLSQNL